MWAFVFFLSLLCAVFAYVWYLEVNKHTKFFEEYCEVKAHQELAMEAIPKPLPVNDDAEAKQKPISVDSIRTALRFNGISPEIPDTHDPGIVYFKLKETTYRINAEHLPYISIEVGYGLNEEPKEDASLMYHAASDITSQMFIGKAYVMGDAEAIIFSVELLCDSYTHFRDNLKQYLDILSEVSRKFSEAHEALKKRKKENLDAVFSGRCFVRDSAVKQKILS